MNTTQIMLFPHKSKSDPRRPVARGHRAVHRFPSGQDGWWVGCELCKEITANFNEKPM